MSSEYLAIKRPEFIEPTIQYVNKAFDPDPQIVHQTRVSFDLGKSGKYNQDDNNNALRDSNDHKPRALSIQSTLSDRSPSKGEILRSLFKVNNAVEIFKGITKRREEKAHILLWLTITIYFVFLCNSNGMPLILVSDLVSNEFEQLFKI